MSQRLRRTAGRWAAWCGASGVVWCAGIAGGVQDSGAADGDEAPVAEAGAVGGAGGAGEEEGGRLGGSLDALLGLEEESDAAERAAGVGDAADPSRAALERRLSGREAQDELLQALQQMDESASRIGELGDTGVVTQRLQEEVLRKLEVLIRHAEEQEQSSSSSSSGNSQQSSQQQQRQQSPGDQSSASRAGEQSGEQRTGENRGGDAPPPSRQDEELNDLVESASAAWGALPARVREALLQGLNDRFSSLYERETEAYYRRLAEEAEAGER